MSSRKAIFHMSYDVLNRNTMPSISSDPCITQNQVSTLNDPFTRVLKELDNQVSFNDIWVDIGIYNFQVLWVVKALSPS